MSPENQQEPSSFTRAIECLQSGDSKTAEKLFKETIKELGSANNQSILSYKSLISLASEEGNFTKALNYSLDLLDAQIQTLGIRHADCTRTLNNVHTLCNTLGNKELAEEIMAMARDAERATVASSVKKLRTSDEILEEEEEEEKPGVKTIFMMPLAPITNWLDSLGEAIKSAVAVICLLGFVLVTFTTFGILWLLDNQTKNRFSETTNHAYLGAGGVVNLSFEDNGKKANFKLGDQNLVLPTQLYSGSPGDFGRLILSSPMEREYWLEARSDGLVSGDNLIFYGPKSPELDILTYMQNAMVAADRCHREEKTYPSSFGKGSDYSFDYVNPFTARVDYPIVTKLKLPTQGFADRNQFFNHLKAGGSWPGEPALYPGSINCCQLVAETQTSFFEDFIVHGCNRSGRIFQGPDGRALLLVSERGTVQELPPLRSGSITGATRLCIWTNSYSGPGLFLLMNRLCLFYGSLAAVYLLLAKLFKEPKSKITAALIGFAMLSMSLLSAFGWMIK